MVPFVLCFGVEFLCFLNLMYIFIFSSPEPKAHKVAYSMIVEPSSVRALISGCVRVFKHFNTNISATSQLIAIKIYLKHN